MEMQSIWSTLHIRYNDCYDPYEHQIYILTKNSGSEHKDCNKIHWYGLLK